MNIEDIRRLAREQAERLASMDKLASTPVRERRSRKPRGKAPEYRNTYVHSGTHNGGGCSPK